MKKQAKAAYDFTGEMLVSMWARVWTEGTRKLFFGLLAYVALTVFGWKKINVTSWETFAVYYLAWLGAMLTGHIVDKRVNKANPVAEPEEPDEPLAPAPPPPKPEPAPPPPHPQPPQPGVQQ